MKVRVDENKCIGCNMCHDVTEGVIGVDFGKNGKAGVNPQADLGNLEVQEKIKLAAEMCPMQAIEIEED